MFMITYIDKATAKDYLEKHSIFFHKIFSKFFLWNGEDIPSSRLVTLSISGVPFLIRDGSLFDKIGSQFGDVIQKLSFSWQNEDNSSGLVKTVTSLMTKIDEVVVIKWNEKIVTARVLESCEQWLFNCDNYSTVDSNDSELESVSKEEEVSDDMEEVEEGDIRQNSASEVNKQFNGKQPAMVGERVSPTRGNESSPVDIGRSPEFQTSPEGQKSGCIRDCVETCNLHGVGVHVAHVSNNYGGNGDKSNKSTNYNNVVDCGLNNFNIGENISGPNDTFEGEGPTPVGNLGKRNRDERSPPSFGSIQGPAQRPVYHTQKSLVVQLDVNSPIGDKYGTEEGGPCSD
ncbi:hypothetical protein Hanom_Chr12g01119641 [Helianthus anomalus]